MVQNKSPSDTVLYANGTGSEKITFCYKTDPRNLLEKGEED